MQSTELSEVEVYGDPTKAACWVYEVFAGGRLVYVGIADNFERRWYQHTRDSWWLGEVEVENVQVLGFTSRSSARMIEAARINQKSPVYNTNPETPSYRKWQESDPETLRHVARRWFRPAGSDRVAIDRNRSLSFESVGLWHRAKEVLGARFPVSDLAQVHPNPDAWGPFNEVHDLEGPLAQLQALGYADVHDDWVELHAEGCE